MYIYICIMTYYVYAYIHYTYILCILNMWMTDDVWLCTSLKSCKLVFIVVFSCVLRDTLESTSKTGKSTMTIYIYIHIHTNTYVYIYIMSKRLSPRGYPCCQVGHEPKMLMELGDNPLKTHRSKAGKLNPLDLGKATGEWSVKLWSCDFQEMDRNGGDSKRI